MLTQVGSIFNAVLKKTAHAHSRTVGVRSMASSPAIRYDTYKGDC
jgi:hypothetical protein